MDNAYQDRERVFAGVMADRADWDAATRAQRHLAVAADAELRRRHPEQRFTPLRSAEPPPATDAQRAELTLTAGPRHPGWRASGSRTWPPDAGRSPTSSPSRQSLMIPSEDLDYGDLGQAFPVLDRPREGAILQPPKPEIRPSARVLERVLDRDTEMEAGD